MSEGSCWSSVWPLLRPKNKRRIRRRLGWRREGKGAREEVHVWGPAKLSKSTKGGRNKKKQASRFSAKSRCYLRKYFRCRSFSTCYLSRNFKSTRRKWEHAVPQVVKGPHLRFLELTYRVNLPIMNRAENHQGCKRGRRAARGSTRSLHQSTGPFLNRGPRRLVLKDVYLRTKSFYFNWFGLLPSF